MYVPSSVKKTLNCVDHASVNLKAEDQAELLPLRDERESSSVDGFPIDEFPGRWILNFGLDEFIEDRGVFYFLKDVVAFDVCTDELTFCVHIVKCKENLQETGLEQLFGEAMCWITME